MSSVNRRVTALASLVLGGLGTELVILMCCCDVTESGVWLLTAQKPIKRPGWYKVCCIFDANKLSTLEAGGVREKAKRHFRGKLMSLKFQSASLQKQSWPWKCSLEVGLGIESWRWP